MAASCGMAPLGELANPGPIKVEDPGFFDIGAGYGTTFGDGATMDGYLFSVKAYPAGRWYSTAVSITDEAKKNITEALADNQDGQDTATLDKIKSEMATWDTQGSWSNQAVPLKCASPWKRWSVFYGHSLGDFEGSGVNGSYKCFGIGYDFAPEFALQLGYGTLNPTGGGKLDHQFFVGISLNLNAFRSLASGATL